MRLGLLLLLVASAIGSPAVAADAPAYRWDWSAGDKQFVLRVIDRAPLTVAVPNGERRLNGLEIVVRLRCRAEEAARPKGPLRIGCNVEDAAVRGVQAPGERPDGEVMRTLAATFRAMSVELAQEPGGRIRFLDVEWRGEQFHDGRERDIQRWANRLEFGFAAMDLALPAGTPVAAGWTQRENLLRQPVRFAFEGREADGVLGAQFTAELADATLSGGYFFDVAAGHAREALVELSSGGVASQQAHLLWVDPAREVPSLGESGVVASLSPSR